MNQQQQQKSTAPWILSLILGVGTITGWINAYSGESTVVRIKADNNERRVALLEEQVAVLNKTVNEMSRDVSWIRAWTEKRP